MRAYAYSSYVTLNSRNAPVARSANIPKYTPVKVIVRVISVHSPAGDIHSTFESLQNQEDVLACRVPEDTIAVMATNMDIHNKDNPGGSFITIQNGSYFGVPYRCLLPQGVENLLVAGRCISADALAGSAIRMIPCCLAFGQAAGTAATLSLKKHINPVDVCVGELRACLEKQDVYLGGE